MQPFGAFSISFHLVVTGMGSLEDAAGSWKGVSALDHAAAAAAFAASGTKSDIVVWVRCNTIQVIRLIGFGAILFGLLGLLGLVGH